MTFSKFKIKLRSWLITGCIRMHQDDQIETGNKVLQGPFLRLDWGWHHGIIYNGLIADFALYSKNFSCVEYKRDRGPECPRGRKCRKIMCIHFFTNSIFTSKLQNWKSNDLSQVQKINFHKKQFCKSYSRSL